MTAKYSHLMVLLSATLLAGALLLLPDGASLRLRRLGHCFIAPGEEIVAMGARVSRSALGGMPHGFTAAERDQLRLDAAQARAELQSFEAVRLELEAENRTLHSLFSHIQVKRDYSLVLAEVIRQPAWRAGAAEIAIDRGVADGLRNGQAALTQDGFVGVVCEVTARRAVVRLVNSPRFALAAEMPSRKVSGIVEMRGGVLRMTAPMGEGYSDVRRGDQIFTSDMAGEDMQPGLLIGSVTDVETAVDGTPMYCIALASDIKSEAERTQIPRFVLIAIPPMR